MPRIEVDPGQLSAASGAQDQAAGTLGGAGQSLQVAADNVASAAGSGDVSGALGAWGAGWATALSALAEAVGATGGNVNAASGAYTTTDSSAMPMGAR
jgi:uncharacterized protein YukE